MSKKLLDVIFVLGSSGLRGSDDLETQKKTVEKFINTQKITDAIYGLIYYGKVPEVVLSLKEKSRDQKLRDTMKHVSWKEEGKSLPEALEKANDMFKKEGRPFSRKVLIFFTNEDPERPLDNSSKILKDNDVKVIPVAVGDDIVPDILRKSNPKNLVIVVDKQGKPEEGKPTIEEEALNGNFKIYHGCTSLKYLPIYQYSANTFYLDPCFNKRCKPFESCVIEADDMTKCGMYNT